MIQRVLVGELLGIVGFEGLTVIAGRSGRRTEVGGLTDEMLIQVDLDVFLISPVFLAFLVLIHGLE